MSTVIELSDVSTKLKTVIHSDKVNFEFNGRAVFITPYFEKKQTVHSDDPFGELYGMLQGSKLSSAYKENKIKEMELERARENSLHS